MTQTKIGKDEDEGASVETLSITSTSRNTALVDDIVLRETQTTRLVFRPMMVNNLNDPKAAVRGHFIFQKKSRAGSWVDHKEVTLSHLKAEEWVKLELKCEELYKLFQSLNELYALHAQAGIPSGSAQYWKIGTHVDGLLQVDEDELAHYLEVRSDVGAEIVLRLLDWFAETGNRDGVIARLGKYNGRQKLDREMAGVKVQYQPCANNTPLNSRHKLCKKS